MLRGLLLVGGFRRRMTFVLHCREAIGQSRGRRLELEFGRVVPVKGVKARYVRGYTKGGSLSALNCWQEIEVYALPAK